MARRGENIYKRKDGRWEGRYRYFSAAEGKMKYRSVYARSYHEVKEKLSRLKNDSVHYTPSGSLTVKTLFDDWLAAVHLRVKASTYANYCMKVKKHILPAFGCILYERLTAGVIHTFMEQKLKCGLSPKYVSDIIIVFKSMAKYAEKEYGYRNPLRNVMLPKTEKKKMRLFSEQQQKTLSSYAMQDITPTKIGILLSFYTGIRIGELCALQWEDMDLDQGILTVSKTIQRIASPQGSHATKLLIDRPKSRSAVREIPLPSFLLKLLQAYRQQDEIYVVSQKDEPLDPRTMQYRFHALLKKAQLPSINFHALRHMFATNCVALGFDIKTLSELLGHSSVETTLNRYVHSSMERKLPACVW